MAIADKIKYKGFNINIHYDDDPMNPRTEWDNFATMVCWHNRYTLGDIDKPSDDPEYHLRQLANEADPTVDDRIDYWENGDGWTTLLNRYNQSKDMFNASNDRVQSIIHKALDKHYIMLPLYLYDHSGITISTGPFGCPWDSGQVGYIYVSKEKVRKEYGWKVLTKQRIAKINEILESEVKVYDDYLRGAVYGYTIAPIYEDSLIKCDDSCWGFYGNNWDDLIDDAQSAIDWCIERFNTKLENERALATIEEVGEFQW
jgi:hypothetical protein